MERRLQRRGQGAFLIAKDIAGDPGFAAKRNGSIAIRREFGRHRRHRLGRNRQRVAGGQDQRDRLALSLDQRRGRPQLRRATGCRSDISRLEEKQTLLGGRMSNALGGGGSTSPVPRRRGAARFRQRLERRR